MLLVPLLIVIVGLAVVCVREMPKRFRESARTRKMAGSLATSVRLTNVENTCAVLLSKAPPIPEQVEDGRARQRDLMRRAQDLRAWALAGRGGSAGGTQRRMAQ
jgi:hypothetical protein